jgi:hypothetical protein
MAAYAFLGARLLERCERRADAHSKALSGEEKKAI